MMDAATPALIDRGHLDSQTFGDDDLRRELLSLFGGQCRRLAPLIADAAGSARDRADFAHTLKGSALGIGAERIAAIAAAIEDGFRRQGRPPEGALRDLGECVAATLAEIGRMA